MSSLNKEEIKVKPLFDDKDKNQESKTTIVTSSQSPAG